jgi:hypothetical protein
MSVWTCVKCGKKDHPVYEEVRYDEAGGRLVVSKLKCIHCFYEISVTGVEMRVPARRVCAT